MSEEWRLRVTFREAGHARALTDRLEAAELTHDLATSFHDRVFVSRDGPEVLCYAGTREQADGADNLIRSLASEHGWHLDSELDCWDHEAAEYRDPQRSPHHGGQRAAGQHRKLIEAERAESQARGYPEWEIRVQCASHHDALRLADQLTAEGIPNVHRWKYLVLGAWDEDSAEATAKRVRGEAPAGTTATVEASVQAVLAAMPRRPFAVFGGLGM